MITVYLVCMLHCNNMITVYLVCVLHFDYADLPESAATDNFEYLEVLLAEAHGLDSIRHRFH